MVELEDLQESDRETIHKLLENHIDYTKSPKAIEILKGWPSCEITSNLHF